MRAAYNPFLFKAGSDGATACVALGSQDTKLTVWLTAAKRPFIIVTDLFKQSVVDMAWTPDGYCLLACSTDGTVAAIQLDKEELGDPIDQVSNFLHLLLHRLMGWMRK